MYPKVLDEFETIELAHKGHNLARYGDGELKLALGKDCVSQPFDPNLKIELREVLTRPAKSCLPCIPNVFSKTPKQKSWFNWTGPNVTCLYDANRTYGSSFVTRPDSAPWIDKPEYWERIKDFWRGKNVCLVAGTMRSLRPTMLLEAKTVYFVEAPSGQKRDGAYAKIDQLEEQTKDFPGPVLLCIGPTATVLANRLAKRGVHATDLGHVGMFMRSAGAYRYSLDDLISPRYRALLIEKHAKSKKWGTDSEKHVGAVKALADEIQAEKAPDLVTILDYGCGKMLLAEAMKPQRVMGYDPGIPGREGMPKPCDLVVATDILEHVELDRLNNVFGHIRSVMLKAGYFVIALRPANASLPDGRNAHLIVKDAKWWLKGLQIAGFGIAGYEEDAGRELRVWVRK